MKSSRRRQFSKPPVIKQNPAILHRFRQRKKTKAALFRFRLKLSSKPVNISNKQPVKQLNEQSPPSESQPKQLVNTLQKSWWTPVWNGLVMDESGKHQKAMRQAIWLYLFLLSAASRRTGTLFRKLSTITEETGFHRRSVERWLRTLRDKGYIETISNGRALQISISKWKPIVKDKSEKKRGSVDL